MRLPQPTPLGTRYCQIVAKLHRLKLEGAPDDERRRLEEFASKVWRLASEADRAYIDHWLTEYWKGELG